MHIHGRPTVAEVSLGALRHNCRRVRELVGPGVAVLAVVKADAYGHGAVPAARAFLAAGAWGLGVSSVTEGTELRRAGVAAPIVVLGGVFAGEEKDVVASDLEVALWDADRARALATPSRPVRVHLKVDTGMTRLGLDLSQVREFGELVRGTPGLEIAGAFSHFASADAVDTAAARAQVARFVGALEALAAAGIRPRHVHLANSAGVLAAPGAHFTMVRPGIMLYGYAPASHLAERAALRPAMRLSTAITQTRHVPAKRRALGQVGGGGVAVEHDPGPYRGEVRAGGREHPRAVREVDVPRADAGRGERLDRAREARRLRARRRRVDGVGRGEVGEDARDLEPGRPAHQLAELAHLGQVEAEPRHARVDLQVDAHRMAGGGERPGPIGVPERDLEIARDDGLLLAGERAAQHDDRRGHPRAPELRALGDARDAETPRAGREESARRRHGAVPVGVGLHHRQHRHARADELADPAAVVAEGREAHLGDRGPPVNVHRRSFITNGRRGCRGGAHVRRPVVSSVAGPRRAGYRHRTSCTSW